MSASVVRWQGQTRSGSFQAGAFGSGIDLRAEVEWRFKAGWRSLTVRRDGDVVAAIERQYDHSDRRTWWSS